MLLQLGGDPAALRTDFNYAYADDDRGGGGDERTAKPPGVLLSVIHGPNDGEILNGSVDFCLEARWPSTIVLLVYRNDLYQTSLCIPGPSLAPRRVRYTFNTASAPDGPCQLSFRLYSPELEGVVSECRFSGSVDNPRLRIRQDTGSPNRAIFEIESRSQDQRFRVEASDQPALLEPQPTPRQAKPGVVTVQQGRFRAKSSPDGVKQEFVIDLDKFSQFQGKGLHFVLWVFQSDRGWARTEIQEAPSFFGIAAPESGGASTGSAGSAEASSAGSMQRLSPAVLGF
jgi:hypothetical protein